MLKFKIKENLKDFVAINLGNYFIKGLIIKDNKIYDYFIEKRTDLVSLIKKIWQEKKIQTDKVKLSIKDLNCLVRIFPFIKLERKKLKEALAYELSKHIPFSSQEVYFDFFILNELSQNEVNLLLAVSKKDIIDKIIETFENQKLNILEITLDSVSTINLFLNKYKEDKNFNVSILDIGYSLSTLILLEKGIPFVLREITFGTKDIVNIILNLKNISDIDKWLFELKDYEEFFKVSGDILFNLCKEIRTSFDYFELKKAKPIEKLYITGGIANIFYKGKFFQHTLNVKTDVLNKNSQLPDLFKEAFSVALGLTL